MTDGTQTGEVLTRTQQFESICKILEEFEYREEKMRN